MKTENLQHLGPHGAAAAPKARRGATALLGLLLVATATQLAATPVVDTVTGGPSPGYVDGSTANEALFHTPIGLALDSSASILYVADRDNQAIRKLDLGIDETLTFLPNDVVLASSITNPVGVVVDRADNLYVLNRGNGSNGTVLEFDAYGDPVATNAVGLINANALAIDYLANIYVTVEGNKVRRITPGGVNTIVATITNAGALLQGIAVMSGGSLAVCDAGRNGILVINPANGIYTNLTGFNGAGDHFGTKAFAKFNQPYGITAAGGSVLVVTDNGNHRVKVVDAVGTVTNLYGVCSNNWNVVPGNPSVFPGWWDGNGCLSEITCQTCANYAEARDPRGVLFASTGDIYTTEDYYHLIRKVTGVSLPPFPPPPPTAPTILTVTTNYGQVGLTWSVVTGATNYNIKRSQSIGGSYSTVGSTASTAFSDTTVLNGNTYYYVVSASNGGGEGPNSAEVVATPPLPPVADPQIGYVDFPPTGAPFPGTSLFHPISSVVLNNNAYIVIRGAFGSQTFFTFGPTNPPNPTSSSASAPTGYQDGLTESEVDASYKVAQVQPDLTIKAIGEKNDGSPNSAIVQARFQFVTGNPVITGNNAAQFYLSDITSNARLYYTVDGSDPSPANFSAVDLGTVASPTNVWTVSLMMQSNTLFKVRAYRDNYQSSAIVSNVFYATNFGADTLTFGFASGEASSEFIAAPGQLFYAPVTLSVLPNPKMFSLQFNVTVTNLASAPMVPGGDFRFDSMLEKPITDRPGYFTRIPPAMFVNFTTNIYFDGSKIVTNLIPNFTNMVFSSQNLLGIGWLERPPEKNLYDTTLQDLIKYSQAHDTQFLEGDGKVIAGGYAFRVPGTAAPGDQYRIRLGSPSATSDGVGGPGSSVFIDTPTNGSLTVGPINSIKHVTVGQRKYVVGDAAPFRWFNAGDFGNTNLLNDDVMQVFQSAIYSVNYPPYDEKSWNGIGYTNVSDLYDGMDSCCGTYVAQPGTDYLVPDGGNVPHNPLFEAEDSTINLIAFGDGILDVTDIFVTFRRSLDPSLQWFQRFWTNGYPGVRVAQFYPNQVAPNPGPVPVAAASNVTSEVQFTAGDGVVAAGQTVYVPIDAHIHGNYPLRLAALGLTVEPLDGSPAITAQVQFTPNSALGAPAISAAKGSANYAAAWLDKGITGLTGDVSLGTLQITLPANCTSNSAYAIHFDHASASPNGLASFPRRTRTGLMTVRDRSASSFGDGIPDSWRLRHFGTLNNMLSLATADADGDGMDNLHEYLAGTDPNDAASVLKLKSGKGQAQSVSVRWPSVLSKQYVIERAASLYAPAWTPVSTNTGTGWDMEYQDNSTNLGSRFYRVRVLP